MQLWLMTKQGSFHDRTSAKELPTGANDCRPNLDSVGLFIIRIRLSFWLCRWHCGSWAVPYAFPVTICLLPMNVYSAEYRGLQASTPRHCCLTMTLPRKHQVHRSGARCQPFFRHWRSLPPARRESPSPFLKPLLRLKVSWGHWNGYGRKRSRP
jgi:hypothetical protein